MTNISGSVLRAVADWYDTQDGTDVLVSRLRDDAEKVDVEVERIDRLARIQWAVHQECASGQGFGFDDWGDLSPLVRDRVRAGVRAVLDTLAEDRETALINYRRVQREPQQWDRIEDVPVVVKVVDLKGRKWRHFAEGWMVWTRDDWMLPWHENRNKFAPFTEVVDGAQ